MQKPIKIEDGYAISIYSDEMPEKIDYAQATNRLSIAFPKMSKEFFVLLTEFIIKEKFTKQRLKDAVNHLISNFQYKELNISDVIKFDKRVKIYTNSEFQAMVFKGQAVYGDYEIKRIDGVPYRIKKTDLL